MGLNSGDLSALTGGNIVINRKVGELKQLERPLGNLTSEVSLETFLSFLLAEFVWVGRDFVGVLFIVRIG